MVEFYIMMINKGVITLDKVSEKWYDAVVAQIAAENDAGSGTV